MAKLGPRLQEHWSPCPEWKINAVKFWHHEWMKHGTCTNDSVLHYFNRTLALYEAAKAREWYGCCGDTHGQCLLHFNTTSDRWLGVC